jgi:hypothetical protein
MYFAGVRGQRDILMAAMPDNWHARQRCLPEFR